jgi:hypothetical protein
VLRWRSALDLRYWLLLRGLEKGKPPGYRAYLEGQLRRSLSKRSAGPSVGARVLVREVARRAGRGASVLCVGCRTGDELDWFQARGLEPVGIDLFSQRPDILVMDMHETLFPDRQLRRCLCLALARACLRPAPAASAAFR